MKRAVAILTGLVVAAAVSCSRGGVIVGLSPLCKEADQATRVSCEQAVLVAQAVALSHHVTTEDPRAEVKPEAVAKGRSSPAWWVTFRFVVYHSPAGGSCVPGSYTVIVDAATGRLLAFDDPRPDC